MRGKLLSERKYEYLHITAEIAAAEFTLDYDRYPRTLDICPHCIDAIMHKSRRRRFLNGIFLKLNLKKSDGEV